MALWLYVCFGVGNRLNWLEEFVRLRLEFSLVLADHIPSGRQPPPRHTLAHYDDYLVLKSI